MSNKAKKEIQAALEKLGPDLIKETLSVVPRLITPSSATLPPEQKYLKAVVYCALERFEKILPAEVKARSAKTLGVTDLAASLIDVDIDLFVNSAQNELLKQYAIKLNLHGVGSSRDTLRRNVSDELMLTGTEAFLSSLPTDLLSRYCQKLGITKKEITETKQFVEELMVFIFQLDPIASPNKKQSETSASTSASTSPSTTPQLNEKRKKSSSTRKKKGEEETDGDDNNIEEEEEEEEQNEAKKKKPNGNDDDDDDDIPKGYYDKDHKWIAPPFEAILQGKYTAQAMNDNFNMDDLHKFCKEHGLPCGKKSACIRTILQFVANGNQKK